MRPLPRRNNSRAVVQPPHSITGQFQLYPVTRCVCDELTMLYVIHGLDLTSANNDEPDTMEVQDNGIEDGSDLSESETGTAAPASKCGPPTPVLRSNPMMPVCV